MNQTQSGIAEVAIFSAMPDQDFVQIVLQTLVSGGSLDASTADDLFERLLSGGLDDAQIGAVLSIIATRRTTPAELLGAARVMRRHVTPVPIEPGPGESLIDTCGTGGAAKTFNISTMAALVAAAAEPAKDSGVTRVLVAKHGNRSRTGRGSAEVLAQLGVHVDAGPDVQAACLREVGVCFCFAIHHHPAMRHAAGPRRSLGFPTIFNLLGPLTNPAGAKRQMIGVYRPEKVGVVAQALQALGSTGVVLHSRDGMDEVSTDAPTDAAWVSATGLRVESIDPKRFGVRGAPPAALAARDVSHAAELARGAIDGSSPAHSDAVALNAGLALVVAGAAGSIADGLERARAAIKSGAAVEKLEALAKVSKG